MGLSLSLFFQSSMMKLFSATVFLLLAMISVPAAWSCFSWLKELLPPFTQTKPPGRDYQDYQDYQAKSVEPWVQGCFFEGIYRENGDQWKCDCNLCMCLNGNVAQTKKGCGDYEAKAKDGTSPKGADTAQTRQTRDYIIGARMAH